jgi:solute carrier family 25 carnitine/acylcarnitine transporter 20/29
MPNLLIEEAVGGLSAGIVGTVIGFPLDTVKARQQTGRATTGIVRTLASILQTEGPRSLYRGLVPPLLSLSFLNTVNFTSYSYFQNMYQAQRGWDVRNAIAGATVGPLSSIVSTVENLIKTQLQLDAQQQYKGSLDCLRQLVKNNQLSVLYTGHVVNTTREVVFIATYFGVYEGLRESMIRQSSQNDATLRMWAIPAAGGLVGAIAWATSFPLDCVRAGVQGQDLSAMTRKSGILVCKELIQVKGIRGLYAGVAPSIVRAFLVSGSRFSAYEGALWLLRGGRDNVLT